MSTFSVGPRPMGMPRVYRDRTRWQRTHSVWSSEPDARGRVRMYCGLEVATKLTRVTPDKAAETDCPECLRALAAERLDEIPRRVVRVDRGFYEPHEEEEP